MYRLATAKRQQRAFADDFADEFEHAPIQNTAHEDILDDDQLAQLCDTTAALRTASDCREGTHGADSDAIEDFEAAWITIDDVARQRALEVVAEACAKIIQDGDQGVEEGFWVDETMDEAQQEAREWIDAHTNATHRANVAEGFIQ